MKSPRKSPARTFHSSESQRRSEGVGFFSNIIENHDEPRGVSYYLPDYAQLLAELTPPEEEGSLLRAVRK